MIACEFVIVLLKTALRRSAAVARERPTWAQLSAEDHNCSGNLLQRSGLVVAT